MLCENKFCNKDISHGNLVCIDLMGQELTTGVVKKLKMLVSVCDSCITKYDYNEKVVGAVNIVS